MGLAQDTWGVLYMLWGNSHDHLLERSLEALKKHHPELPVHVHRVPMGDKECGTAEMFLAKASMAGISPFENTLYLDADTIVMGSLDYAFEKAARFGLACSICECPWAQRYAGLNHLESLVEYNTGVLFFTQKARQALYMWERLVRTVDSSVKYIDHGVEKVMQHNDQAAFARAVDMTEFNPYVLPLNWNFRPRWNRCFYGPIRIWHDVSNPSPELYKINEYYDNRDAIFMDVNLTTVDSRAGIKSTPLPDSGVDLLPPPRNLASIGQFLDRLAADLYPEKPSLMHAEITGRALEHLEGIFPLRAGMRVIDVGCGQGPALEHFKSRHTDYLGVTLGEEDLIECRARGFNVEKMDQSFLVLPENSQDLVWARHVIEHSIFPLFTLAGFHKVLRDGGMLYLEVPAPETSCHHERNPNHYSVLSKGAWRSLLERSGFTVVGEVDYSFEVPAGPDIYWGFYCRKGVDARPGPPAEGS